MRTYKVDQYEVIDGLPREEISCPSCGKLYGHHNTKVCIKCQECSTCHKKYPDICKKPKFITTKKFIKGGQYV